MKIPAAIAKHPAVLTAELGEGTGTDYRYDLFLRPNWRFTRGRTAGTRTLMCNSVREFRYAEPKKVTE